MNHFVLEFLMGLCLKPFLFLFCLFPIFLIVVDYAQYKSKVIKNLPSVPWVIPIWGSLSLIFPSATHFKDTPCLKFEELSSKYGDVYQVRLGSTLVVVANSYESILKLWCCNNIRGNNSRPILHTFHSILSQSKVFTVGTTPFGESYLKTRKYMASHLLNESSNKSHNGYIIDTEVDRLLQRLIKTLDSTEPNFLEMDVTRESQYFHLAVALSLTYGYQIDIENNEKDKELAEEMIYVENYITKIRSHVQNVQDYLPNILRPIFSYYTDKDNISVDLFQRRKQYLKKLYNFTKESSNSTDPNMMKSLMYNYFNSTEKDTLTESQMGSICLTMVSAGLDNTPLNFQYCMCQLSESPHILKKALECLLSCYDNDPIKAWTNCHIDMSCDYIVVIIKETLRLFTVLPMSLPRYTTKDIVYKDSVIPKGTTLFMNSWAGNHDSKKFYKPMEFIPERFIDQESSKLNPALKHFSFGIGSRMCLGNNLAFKEMYLLICKFILLFDIKPGQHHYPNLNPLEINKFPDSIAVEPKDINLKYSIRDKSFFDALQKKIFKDSSLKHSDSISPPSL